MAKTKFPSDIARSVARAKQLQSELVDQLELHPKRGATTTPKPIEHRKQPAIIFGDTCEELKAGIVALGDILGPRERGNKRWRDIGLYADLMEHARRLQRAGIRLPRNKSLSKKACDHELGEILRVHGKTDLSDAVLERNAVKRQKLGDKMSRVFERVAGVLENTPAKIG